MLQKLAPVVDTKFQTINVIKTKGKTAVMKLKQKYCNENVCCTPQSITLQRYFIRSICRCENKSKISIQHTHKSQA